MKIVHVISSMSLSNGGPSCSTLLTVRGLNHLGVDTQILTKEMLAGETPISTEPFIHYLPVPAFYYERWGYMKVFPKTLSSMSDTDVFHIQGLWQYPGYATARYARKISCPYVVTLRGGMYPEALNHSALIKKTSLLLYERRLLQNAACTHATCTQEMEHYRALGFTNPVAVIPNPMESYAVESPLMADGKKRIGYLGRLHSRKRVERLLEIWKRLNEPGELLIMGDGEPDYVAFLKKEVARLQLSDVRFSGWVSGVEKNRLLASLTCLVVPSDFENFGMIVPEALLQEVPVIASIGSPWKELNTERCGWWVKNDVDNLTAAVRAALSLDKEELQAMGKRGRRLVLDKYSIEAVSRQMKQLYAWVAGQGDNPEFVYD